MIEQLKKLKTKTLITLVLALLAITWQFLNFMTIKDYVPLDNFTSLEVIIIYSSYLFLAVLFISLISLSFTAFRVSMKYNSEKKKEEKLKNTISTTPPSTNTQL
jgi:hypothetical protein